MKRIGNRVSYPAFVANSSLFVWDDLRSNHARLWKGIREILKDFRINQNEIGSQQDFQAFFTQNLKEALNQKGMQEAWVLLDFTSKWFDHKPTERWIPGVREQAWPRVKITTINMKQAHLDLSQNRLEIKLLDSRDQKEFEACLQELNSHHQLGIIEMGLIILPGKKLWQAFKDKDSENKEEVEIDLKEAGDALFSDNYFPPYQNVPLMVLEVSEKCLNSKAEKD